VNVQREQLKRLRVNGDWDKPYLTMDFQAEATIFTELLKFAWHDMLYRGAKPVMWSPVEKTALAEAEVEYEDIVSTQIDVAFEITESAIPELVGAYAVIWTTTPWTIPTNQALAYGPEVEYVLVEVENVGLSGEGTPEGNTFDGFDAPFRSRILNKKYLIARELLESWQGRVVKQGVVELSEFNKLPSILWHTHGVFKGAELAGTKARHPMHALGGFFAEPRPLLSGDFVTTESGTGLVHMAPDHGEDDFLLCKAHGIGPKFVVEADGKYREDWGWLGGQGSVINPKFNAPDGPICSDLREAGALLAASPDYKHSYPHSWRSKAKVIFRCTPQWFVPMDKVLGHLPSKTRAERRWEGEGGAIDPQDETAEASPTLREAALDAIAETRFVPEKGRNRIGAMVEGRPDWVLSRQRAWGVPITLFVDRKSGEYLVDAEVNARIIAAIREIGVDAWSDARAQEYLGTKYSADDYERVVDILDVWFDSGSTHAFVLESGRWPELVPAEDHVGPTADLYLEGSDQHRGWFQSSLLESCATRGHAPYKAVLTHGFTMDAKGFKMSKSLGNTISPIKVMETNGADIIRLWALSVDYTEDHRIGDEILKGVADQYRKLRNTMRYLLGALDGFSDDEKLPVSEMPELERYVLSLLAGVDATLRKAVADFDFNTYVRTLLDFCNEDLSAFFFDIRKDCLYCDAPSDPKRRAYRTVLDTLFHALVRYAAPVTVFTAEEVWQSRFPGSESVHLLEWPDVPAVEADAARWADLRALRVKVTEAIEPLRREKIVGSSLAATVTVPASAPDADLAELFITAKVTRGQGDEVTVTPSTDHKCGRCWRHLPEVSEDGDLCDRCDDVVGAVEEQA